MSHEMMIENIKTKLPHIEPALLNSIWEIVEHAERRPHAPLVSEPTRTQALVGGGLHFIGENLPFDPRRNSSLQERAALKRRLKTQNQAWLSLQFEKLKAAWLVIVDQQVIAWGASLASYPKPDKLLETCQRTGKFPFLFINEEYLSIEGGGARWPQTIIPDDYYPTLTMVFHTGHTAMVITGNFDTGASSTFVDFDARQTEIQSQRNIRAATSKSVKAKSNSTKRRKHG